jgi:hypothetical protein
VKEMYFTDLSFCLFCEDMHGAVVEFLREKISSNFAMLSLLVATVSGFSLAFFGAPFFDERK